MILEVAELKVSVEETDLITGYCNGYKVNITKNDAIEVMIDTKHYSSEKYSLRNQYFVAYMESALQFYRELLRFNGMMLHASAVAYGGRAYLFSGPCGMGKSTHTRLWQRRFGEEAKVFNDDKPALRRMEDRWYAYGTPWCGKDHININMKVPLCGICFLKQAPENKIRRLDSMEALQKLLPQTLYRLKLESNMHLLLSHLDKLIREIPIFELENRPEEAAVELSYETMRRAAEEAGL